MTKRIGTLAFALALTLATVTATPATPPAAATPPSEMGGARPIEGAENPLYVSPERDPAARAELRSRLREGARPDRSLYSPYLARLGSNGILDLIEERWPRCHDEAHDLGKLIFAELESVGPSLRACQGRCNSGCMHGVLMEAFSDFCGATGELRLELLAPAVENVCLDDETMRSSYQVGDCAHGVGHALMFLAQYRVENAIEGCDVFRDPRLRYYCATGAYMEYVTQRDAQDATTRHAFYPCDRHPYPAACARYKLVRVVHRLAQAKQSPAPIVRLCRSLEGAQRRGCFHGLGNALAGEVGAGMVPLGVLCGLGDERDRQVCIEGAIERLARYDKPAAERACVPLEGDAREICDAAVRNELYSLEKDMSLYLEP